MNIFQWIVLGLGILGIAGMWVYDVKFSDNFDVTYSTVVSIVSAAFTAGFVFSFKNLGKK